MVFFIYAFFFSSRVVTDGWNGRAFFRCIFHYKVMERDWFHKFTLHWKLKLPLLLLDNTPMSNYVRVTKFWLTDRRFRVVDPFRVVIKMVVVFSAFFLLVTSCNGWLEWTSFLLVHIPLQSDGDWFHKFTSHWKLKLPLLLLDKTPTSNYVRVTKF